MNIVEKFRENFTSTIEAKIKEVATAKKLEKEAAEHARLMDKYGAAMQMVSRFEQMIINGIKDDKTLIPLYEIPPDCFDWEEVGLTGIASKVMYLLKDNGTIKYSIMYQDDNKTWRALFPNETWSEERYDNLRKQKVQFWIVAENEAK